jgi:YggT family protein
LYAAPWWGCQVQPFSWPAPCQKNTRRLDLGLECNKGLPRTMDVIIGPVLRLLYTVIDLYIWIVFIGVILSWLTQFNVINSSNRFVYMVSDFIHRATEPALGRIRKVLPVLGGIDLSPIALLLGLVLIKDVIFKLLMKFDY